MTGRRGRPPGRRDRALDTVFPEGKSPYDPAGSVAVDPDFRQRITQVIDLYPSVRAAAEAAGKSNDMLLAYRKGASEPPFSVLIKLSKGVGVRLDWLATGDGQMLISDADVDLESSTGPGLTRVPIFNLTLSAGTGQPPWLTEEPIDHMEIPTAYLRDHLRLDPQHTIGFPVVGDSMEPSIRDGEIAVLDWSQTRVARDGVYALRRGDDLYVKRIIRQGKAVVAKSDNPAYDRAFDLDEEWQVIGRVGGAFRRV